VILAAGLVRRQLLAEGSIRIGCVDAGTTLRPRRIPEPVLNRMHDMNQDLSITSLVLHASLVVQLVMAGLLLASLASWTVIFGKLFGLRSMRSRNEAFEREFWSGKSLSEMNQAVVNKTDTAPIERIFASGIREFLKLRERRLDAGAQLDGARRAMRASYQRELDTIESNLSFLASVGSVSPYVGCSAPCGASCMPSSACPTCSR
jgi:hypothetical protein